MPDLGVVMVVGFGVRWRGGRAAAGHYCLFFLFCHVTSRYITVRFGKDVLLH